MPKTFAQRDFRLPSSRVFGKRQREALHFPHAVALWKPKRLSALRAPVDNAGLLIADLEYELATPYQKCFYNSTPETNEAEILGRTRVNNLFTLDVFLFPEGAQVGDTWILYLLTPGDNHHRLYVSQGSPQSVQPGPFHAMGGQRALVARIQTHPSNLPPGVDLTQVERRG